MIGKIIEYVEHGKFICAVVLEQNNKRLRLLNQNGREVNLPGARVVHQSSSKLPTGLSRDEMTKTALEADQQRRSTKLPVPLVDVWQLAIEENQEYFSPDFLTELCFGEEAQDNSIASFLRAVFEDRIYFKYRDGQIQVHNEETVNQLLARKETEEQKEKLLTKGAQNLAAFWSGQTDIDWPEKEQCLKLIHDYYLYDKDAQDFELARELIKRRPPGLLRRSRISPVAPISPSSSRAWRNALALSSRNSVSRIYPISSFNICVCLTSSM